MLGFRKFIIYGTIFLACSFLFILYILGTVHYVTTREENTCEMTYMFEYPQYVRITLHDELEKVFPRFGLYAYGEGFVTEKIRRMKFTGIPVLFIPGNAGSSEQVRSLASVSLRKGLEDRTPFHFDYFAVHLGKDYSGLYGGVLMEETEYVSHCIERVLSLYKGKVKSVVLIGHSMGGIVAKGALLMSPKINATYASILITLATPHRPTIVFDRTFANYYQNLEASMNELKLAGVTSISIGGGPRDHLVTAEQTIDSSADMNLLSNSIPDVWRSTDHLCILWCKQLVLSIVRALFDSVDISARPPMIASDPVDRMRALSYHFQKRFAGKRIRSFQEKFTFESGALWIEDIRKQYVWSGSNYTDDETSKSVIYLMIRFSDFTNQMTIQTLNLETKDWLYVCLASKIEGQSRVCEWGWNLSNKSTILPDILYRRRRSVDLSVEELKLYKYSHVVVRIPPSKERKYVNIQIDTFSQSSRVLNFNEKTSLLKRIFIPKKPMTINSSPGDVRFYVKLLNITDAINVQLDVLQCVNLKKSISGIVELIETWNPGATQFFFLTGSNSESRTLQIQTKQKEEDSVAELRLTLDSSCSYSIIIQQASIVEKISILVRDRWTTLYPISISLLLLTIAVQFDNNRDSLLTAGITFILCVGLGIIFECCVAFIILHLLAICVCCSVVFLGSVAHKIAVKFLARAIAFSITWSDWLLGGLNQLPIVTTIIILSIVPATCGALAMMISIFLQFLKLTRMYDDYLEELFLASMRHFNLIRRRDREKNDNENTRQKIFNQLLLFMVWNFTAISAVPSVLVWAKNFSYSSRLTTEDPVLLYSWILLVICGTLGLVEVPCKRNSVVIRIISFLLRYIAWLIICLTRVPTSFFYQWWLTPSVTVFMILISICSIF